MEWYKEAMQNKGKSIVAPAYTSKATGNPVITIARATNDGNGVVGMNVNLDKIKEITGSIKIGKQGYVYVLDTEHKFIYHPEKKAGSVAPDNVQNNNLYKNETGSFQYQYNDKEKKEMVYTTNELTGWKLAGTFYSSEFTNSAAPILNTTIIVIIISIILGAVLIYFIIRSITKPLARLIASTAKISKGDLSEDIQYTRNDEIGQLANSFNEMVISLREVISSVLKTTEQVAAASEELMASSEQIAESAQEMAEGSEHQVQHVDIATNYSKQMAEGVGEIASSAETVTTTALDTSAKSEAGGNSVKKAIEQMSSIQDTVTSLSEIIQVLGERSSEIGKILL